MQGKIVLEEHFGMTDPDTIGQAAAGFPGDIADEHNARLRDIGERRIAEMDELGIELAVLSLQAPAVQALPDVAQAVDWARRANDYAAEQVAKHPGRFLAFAALPLQDPAAAAAELTRCVEELRFKGALVNGFSQASDGTSASYYDAPPYREFWATVEQLDVPFYLHPRNPPADQTRTYDGHPWLLGSAWAFGIETATHALRLMASGLFDEHPRLQVILGHLGESLPFARWRIDNRFAVSPRSAPALKPLGHYLQHNFHVTTSGNFWTPALMATIAEMGAERVLFSIDYPFEDMAAGARWLDGIEVGETTRELIGRENARRLLKL